MLPLPPTSTLTDTLFPYTTLSRSPTVGGSWASRSSPAANSSGGQARGRGDDTRSRQLDVERGVYRGHQLSDSHSSSDHGRRSPFCWHEPYSPEAAAVTPTAAPRESRRHPLSR